MRGEVLAHLQNNFSRGTWGVLCRSWLCRRTVLSSSIFILREEFANIPHILWPFSLISIQFSLSQRSDWTHNLCLKMLTTWTIRPFLVSSQLKFCHSKGMCTWKLKSGCHQRKWRHHICFVGCKTVILVKKNKTRQQQTGLNSATEDMLPVESKSLKV